MLGEPRRSSVIVPSRGTGRDFEVFWSQRQHHLQFLGGFYAFFGGAVEETDPFVPLSKTPQPGMPDATFYGCAARELFEELGLLVVAPKLLFVREQSELPTIGRLKDFRNRLIDERVDFASELDEAELAVAVDRFRPIGRWVTPEFSPIRFDTEFFLLHLTDAEADRLYSDDFADHLLEEELVTGEWIRPSDALERWRNAELFVSQPIRFVLEELVDAHPDTDALYVEEEDVESTAVMAETAGGIYVMPLESPTLPPATHTNCVIVGDDDFVIIDPGTPHGEEQDRLFELVDEMVDDGRTPTAVLLTHHHQDHMLAAAAAAKRYDIGIWAHPRTIEQTDALDFEHELHDEDLVDLGDDSLVCVFTPGHASGHLCFWHRRTNTVIAGDLVASHGTILVNPPDGHMGAYLQSLRRVRDMGPDGIVPAHGWVITDPVDRLQFYIDHRLEREEKIWDALNSFGAPATAMDLVPDAYDDVPQEVWPIASRSALAHLEHLVELGKASRDGERFQPR